MALLIKDGMVYGTSDGPNGIHLISNDNMPPILSIYRDRIYRGGIAIDNNYNIWNYTYRGPNTGWALLPRYHNIIQAIQVNNVIYALTIYGRILRSDGDSNITDITPDDTIIKSITRNLTGSPYAIDNENRLWVKGNNNYNRLGVSTSGNIIYYMDRWMLTTLTNVKKVACGNNHAIALHYDGNISVCGASDHGEIGIYNDLIDYYEDLDGFPWIYLDNPSLFSGDSSVIGNIASISCGSNYSLLIDNYGRLWYCGNNDNYQLGPKNAIMDDRLRLMVGYVARWTMDTNLHNLTQIACFNSSSFLLDKDGNVWATGYPIMGVFNQRSSDTIQDWTIVFRGADSLFNQDPVYRRQYNKNPRNRAPYIDMNHLNSPLDTAL